MKSTVLRVLFALALMLNAHASLAGADVPAEKLTPAPIAAPVDSFVVRALAHSLGEWVSPHRLIDLSQLLWTQETDAANGIYRCINRYSESLANFKE